MSRNLDIERLSITLHGVSEDIAQAAVHGLDEAIRRRLGDRRIALSGSIPELRIDPLDLPPGTDAQQLRDLIADRLVSAIGTSPTTALGGEMG